MIALSIILPELDHKFRIGQMLCAIERQIADCSFHDMFCLCKDGFKVFVQQCCEQIEFDFV